MKTTKKDNQDTIEDDKEIQPWKGQRNATKQQETKKTKKTGMVFFTGPPLKCQITCKSLQKSVRIS